MYSHVFCLQNIFALPGFTPYSSSFHINLSSHCQFHFNYKSAVNELQVECDPSGYNKSSNSLPNSAIMVFSIGMTLALKIHLPVHLHLTYEYDQFNSALF